MIQKKHGENQNQERQKRIVQESLAYVHVQQICK